MGNGFTSSPMGMYQEMRSWAHNRLEREHLVLRLGLAEILGLGDEAGVEEILDTVRRLTAVPPGGPPAR